MVKNAVIESQDSDIVDIRQLGIGTDSQKIRKSAKTWKHENTVSYRFGNGRKHVTKVFRLSPDQIRLAKVNIESPETNKKIMAVSEIFHISIFSGNDDGSYSLVRNLYIGKHVKKESAVILSSTGDIKRTFHGSLIEGDLLTDLQDGVAIVQKAHSRASEKSEQMFYSAPIKTPTSQGRHDLYVPVVAWFESV